MRKILLGLFVLVACNSAVVRVARPDEALKMHARSVESKIAQANQAELSRPQVKQVIPVGEVASVAPAVIQPVAPAPSETTVTATVDHSASWSGVNGEFDLASSDINDKHFPPEHGGMASVVLVPLALHRDVEDSISNKEVEHRLAVQGFRPATDRELRAFAKANPEFQRQFPVVALGSSWLDPYGNRKVPYLDDWDGKRVLSLHWLGGDWNSRWRFLAVRK